MAHAGACDEMNSQQGYRGGLLTVMAASPATGRPPDRAGVVEPGNPFGNLSLAHSSTVDRVVEELRRALFEGEVQPGTPLREVALADAMGVARSTIREALSVLVAEGLATRAPNRGVHVTELDPDAVHDVCLSRKVIEVAGVRRWAEAGQGAREALHQALAAFTQAADSDADAATLTAAHLAIHRAFVGLTGSPRLTTLADLLSDEVRLGLAKVDRIRGNAHEQVASHRALVELLEAGDVETAARELEAHLEHAETSMLTSLNLSTD